MPVDLLLDQPPADALPLSLVAAPTNGEAPAVPPYARACGFTGAAGTVCLLPDGSGGLERVLAGTGPGGGDGRDPWALAGLPEVLPPRVYVLDPPVEAADADAMATAWALGGYVFDRYKRKAETPAREYARLAWPQGADRAAVRRQVQAIEMVRDLVNTPTEDMGPADLEAAARELAQRYNATVDSVIGEDLLRRNYPAIHAVGRASPRAPRLIDLTWGDRTAPRLTIVGKGVCFDTGGLDLKPASSMRLMKKDMGGAAHALGLALLVMDARLPVRLRVLIPAVENAVAGNAFRPGDILRTRKGLTVEVGNTDAEGRLILADALAEGDSEKPALMIDFATLTGAARVALGPDLPALLTPDDALAEALLAAGRDAGDPLWRLPLWPGYRSMVESRIADLDNAPEGGMAGTITAGLFLQSFVSETTPWAHLDIYAWNQKARPGRPAGGEAQALRAVWRMVQRRFRA